MNDEIDDAGDEESSERALLEDYERLERRHIAEHQAFVDGDEHLPMLIDAGRSFLEVETFNAGDLVTWKSGLKNRRFPSQNEPAVVIEILSEAVSVEAEPDDESIAEHLDLRLGVLLAPGVFRVFHFDSRRFTRFHIR